MNMDPFAQAVSAPEMRQPVPAGLSRGQPEPAASTTTDPAVLHRRASRAERFLDGALAILHKHGIQVTAEDLLKAAGERNGKG